MKRPLLLYFLGICLFSLKNITAQNTSFFTPTQTSDFAKIKTKNIGKVLFLPVSNAVPKGRFKGISIADYWFRHTPTAQQHNFIWWSPFLKGGGGVISRPDGTSTQYVGAFFRPRLKRGEVITAGHYVNTGSKTLYELKGEYRFRNHIGVGGGIANFGEAKTNFLKVNYLNQIKGWNYIIGAMWHRVQGNWFPASYGVLYNASTLLGLGYDSEELRATIGYISPETRRRIRPAFELFWLDRTPGVLANNKFILFMGTLGYRGGILSQSARIGRAMGAGGLEYSNPIIYISPSWNRLLNIWEQGGIADIRTVYFEGSEGNFSAKTEGIVWLFQLDRKANLLDGVFLGGYHLATHLNHSVGVMVGMKKRIKNFGFMAQSEYDFQTQKLIVNAGVSMLFK